MADKVMHFINALGCGITAFAGSFILLILLFGFLNWGYIVPLIISIILGLVAFIKNFDLGYYKLQRKVDSIHEANQKERDERLQHDLDLIARDEARRKGWWV